MFFCTGRINGPYIRVTGMHYRYIRPVHTARMYGPYVRVSKIHPYIRAVNTARIYGCSVHTTRIEYRITVLYGPYIRAVHAVDRYALPVNTGRKYGPYIRMSQMHSYVRAVHTARIYKPYLRVVRIGLKVDIKQTTPHDSIWTLVYWPRWNSNSVTLKGDTRGVRKIATFDK